MSAEICSSATPLISASSQGLPVAIEESHAVRDFKICNNGGQRFYYLPNTLLLRLTDAGLGSLQGVLDAVQGSSLEALMLSRLVVRLPGVETVDIVQSVDKWFFMEGL